MTPRMSAKKIIIPKKPQAYHARPIKPKIRMAPKPIAMTSPTSPNQNFRSEIHC